MRVVLVIAPLAFVGAIVATILFFTGLTTAGPFALLLGAIALTAVIPGVMGRIGDWGVPGDQGWR